MDYGSEVMMRDGSVYKVERACTIKVKMHDGIVRTLGMIKYIPKLKKNIISFGTFDKNGYSYKAKEGKFIISKGSLMVMNGEIQPNCLYRLCGTTVTGELAIYTKKDSEDDTQLWHLRLGHMSERATQEFHKRKFLKGVHSCKLELYKYCIMGKQSKVIFKEQDKENRSIAHYYVTFLDDFSKKVRVYFMKEKSEVFTKFKECKVEIENLTAKKNNILRSDNGGEYKDSKFMEFCKSEGVKRHFIVKKMP
ncbi:unnamed protein product [Prunus armeniaca]